MLEFYRRFRFLFIKIMCHRVFTLAKLFPNMGLNTEFVQYLTHLTP